LVPELFGLIALDWIASLIPEQNIQHNEQIYRTGSHFSK
jgi:hypothetical protein